MKRGGKLDPAVIEKARLAKLARRGLDRVSAFWSFVNKASGIFKTVNGQPSECWEWIGALSGLSPGYGSFWIDGKLRKAHVLSYIWARGPIPDGLELDHLCRTRHCVRPDHLEAVTHRVNQERGNSVSGLHMRQATCPKGHLYDRIEQSGHRRCLTCKKATSDAYRKAHLAHYAELQRNHKAKVRAQKLQNEEKESV